jgi:hypothetical protein
MIGFEFSVNGERLYTVGVGDIGRIIAQMEWTNGKINPDVFVRNSIWVGARAHSPMLGKHRHWQCRELKLGDEVTIKVVETDSPDQPLPADQLPDYPDIRNSN